MLKIETERLILTNYKPEDFERVHIYCINASILIYEAWGPNTEAETKAFLAKAISESKAQPRLNYELAIRLRSNASKNTSAENQIFRKIGNYNLCKKIFTRL